jgi:drug/metabolite transporter (DMT)-like permease
MAVVGVVAALEPVYGIAAAWLFLGEQPSALMLSGGALIIGASVLSLLQTNEFGPNTDRVQLGRFIWKP